MRKRGLTMADDVLGVFWAPEGQTVPDIGTKALIDVTDGDTPNIRMPVRLLSVDTPEVTAKTETRARAIDQEFVALAGWIRAGQAPVSRRWGDYILPKLESASAGTRQFTAGRAASAWFKDQTAARLKRPDGSQRSLFVRLGEAPFDDNGRLLAYVAPNYTDRERATMSRAERATFNLDLVASGWASAFVLFPNVPGGRDYPMLTGAAVAAIAQGLGQWADPLVMPAYEYRMCEKLHAITRRIVAGETLSCAQRFAWRSRYCADARTRLLYGPEDYQAVPPPWRLWIWPDDVQGAVQALNLTPSKDLATGEG
jgi:endonuclease YncB( thermonuclease family)